MRDSAPENLSWQVAPHLHAERAGFDDPVVRHCLDVRCEMLATALATYDEIMKGRIRPLEHVKSIRRRKGEQTVESTTKSRYVRLLESGHGRWRRCSQAEADLKLRAG
jgi:hypothetical protein